MRRPNSIEFANAFLWLTVLAASVILYWGSDRLWMLVVAVLVSGCASVRVVAEGQRQAE
jgi:hypothetical protein